MSQLTHRLDRVLENVAQVLRPTTVGTEASARTVTFVDLAARQANDRAADTAPGTSTDASRGGSSSVTAKEDSIEAARVSRQAAKDATRLPDIVAQLDHLASELYDMVVRQTRVVDHEQLTLTSEGLPGCRSCARVSHKKGVKAGGHFQPAMPEATETTPDGKTIKGNALAASLGLCRWCFEVATVVALEEGLTPSCIGREHWPPIEACDRYHRESPQAAGRFVSSWLEHRKKGAA